jgi:diguanylate cyclase (GGDEF)-like protein
VSPGADSVAAALAAIWDSQLEAILAQVAIVERAAHDALHGELDEALHDLARREAHKLAGSLGTFGLAEASREASRAEHLLTGRIDDAGALAASAGRLRVAVEHGPPKATTVTPAEAADDDAPFLLVVEDDRTVAERLCAEATRRGLRAEAVATPDAGRAAIAERRPSVVLLDLMFDGTPEPAYGLLSELSSGPHPVPVLVFTARDVFTDRVEVARRGGRGFLPKSMEPRQAIDQAMQLVEWTDAEGTTLLAVDDDPAMLAAIRAVLEPEGLRIKTLNEPMRFWEELERVSPDMLMLDIDMPEVNGIELCRVVRNDRRWAALPVLFLTSRRDEATVRAVFASGADDYLHKPVVREELVGRVRSRLERARLHRLLAERDALTGVLNRQSSVRGIERLLALSRRYGEPVSLVAVDLDHFKRVNDVHGHAAGDAVLRRLGEMLLQGFRGEDIVGRWGGEEFVVGMYGMALADAERRMLELLRSFAGERFTTADGAEFTNTFSAGIAAFDPEHDDLPALHRAADAALYSAKDAGRNCVQLARSAVPTR